MDKSHPLVKRKPDYGILNMDAQLEEVVGNKLELVGPMIDSNIHEIGKLMKCKLSKSEASGLVNPVTLFIPWTNTNIVFIYWTGACILFEVSTEVIVYVLDIFPDHEEYITYLQNIQI